MDERLDYEKPLKAAKMRAKELFKNVPEDVRKELEKESRYY